MVHSREKNALNPTTYSINTYLDKSFFLVRNYNTEIKTPSPIRLRISYFFDLVPDDLIKKNSKLLKPVDYSNGNTTVFSVSEDIFTLLRSFFLESPSLFGEKVNETLAKTQMFAYRNHLKKRIEVVNPFNLPGLSLLPEDFLKFICPHYTFIEINYSPQAILLDLALTEGLHCPLLSSLVDNTEFFLANINKESVHRTTFVEEKDLLFLFNNEIKTIRNTLDYKKLVIDEALILEILLIQEKLTTHFRRIFLKKFKEFFKFHFSMNEVNVESIINEFVKFLEKSTSSKNLKSFFYQDIFIQITLLQQKLSLTRYLQETFSEFLESHPHNLLDALFLRFKHTKDSDDIFKNPLYLNPSIIYSNKFILFFTFKRTFQEKRLKPLVTRYNETYLKNLKINFKVLPQDKPFSINNTCLDFDLDSSFNKFVKSNPSFMDFLIIHLYFKEFCCEQPAKMIKFLDFTLNNKFKYFLQKERTLNSRVDFSVPLKSDLGIFEKIRYYIFRYVFLKKLSHKGKKKFSSYFNLEKNLNNLVNSIINR